MASPSVEHSLGESSSQASTSSVASVVTKTWTPRPSTRVLPLDEPGMHRVTFTVTISVAFRTG